MSKVVEIESKAEFEAAIKDGTVLVDFFAVWCGPCQAMKPVLEAYVGSAGAVKVLSVDVDKLADVASKYDVMSIPTFVLFVDGEPKEVRTGAMPENELRGWVEKNK
jgi:thioredoxin 1